MKSYGSPPWLPAQLIAAVKLLKPMDDVRIDWMWLADLDPAMEYRFKKKHIVGMHYNTSHCFAGEDYGLGYSPYQAWAG